ncbi:hypothetical protein CT694_20485 [Bacillus wiedmannii bv. thuringiensis]|nr:hypothetical protein CT694_20485 [Bacillus wiedmannii bv. thuringiensis]
MIYPAICMQLDFHLNIRHMRGHYTGN